MAKYASLATVAGLDWATVQTLSDTALERRVVQGRMDRPTHYVLPDYGRAHQGLRRKGMTLMLLWEEYVAAHPGQPTYRYSQFCEQYRLRASAEALDAPDPPRRREALRPLLHKKTAE